MPLVRQSTPSRFMPSSTASRPWNIQKRLGAAVHRLSNLERCLDTVLCRLNDVESGECASRCRLDKVERRVDATETLMREMRKVTSDIEMDATNAGILGYSNVMLLECM